MVKNEIISSLQKLTGHSFIEITPRGDAAITAALSTILKDKIILIPEEGGWLHYKTGPKKIGLLTEEVKCDDAAINL